MRAMVAVMALGCVAAGAGLWGCGQDCEPGRQTSCACPGGEAPGVQTCADDGTWGDCDCSGSGGTGGGTTSSTTSDTGGTGGSTSTGGTGGDCQPPNELCGSDCVNTNTDADHCGECNHACPTEATCVAGECDCPGEQIACGTDCVDGLNDNTNCGGCDHDCQGDACTNGFCPITEIASGLQDPFSLALDGTHVYWANHVVPTPQIIRAELDGASPETVVTNAGVDPREINLVGTNLYWSDYGTSPSNNGEVLRLDLSGSIPGTPEVLNTTQQPWGIWGIGVGGGFLYFANGQALTVKRVDASVPGDPQTFASNEWTPWDVAADATHVYWSNYDGGEIKRRHHTTGAAEVVATGQAAPVGIALTSSHVYFAAETSDQIKRVPLAGGAVEVIVGGQASPTYVAVDSDSVYWTNYSNGTVMKAAQEPDATPTVLAASQANPYYIAVDATHVYWTTLANHTPNGRVARVAK